MKHLILPFAAITGTALGAGEILVEAESFKDLGGWSLDTQFLDSMGSPYLLAHGVRFSVSPHENRAAKAPVTTESAAGSSNVSVNERGPAPLEKGFVSLGKFRFEPGEPAVVIVGDGPADGNVAIDVVQLLPAE